MGAAIFDFVGPSMKGWAENFSTAAIGPLANFTERYKAVFTMNTSAAVFGLGYIMGVDYAAIILAGSLVSFLVLVPLFGYLGQYIPAALPGGALPLAQMAPEDIFFDYVRPIGIGGIFAAGLLYTLGRVLTYALLGWLLVASLATVVGLSNGLQRVMNQLLGPVLILAGMFLLELIRWSRTTPNLTAGLQQRASNWGLGGAVVLGALFALSFCPVSAALFFGSLIPLAMTSGSSVADKNPRASRDRMSRSRRPVNRAGRPRTTKNSVRNIGNCTNASLEPRRACRS